MSERAPDPHFSFGEGPVVGWAARACHAMALERWTLGVMFGLAAILAIVLVATRPGPEDRTVAYNLRLGMAESEVERLAGYAPSRCSGDLVPLWDEVEHVGPYAELNATRSCLSARTEAIWLLGRRHRDEASCTAGAGDSLLGMADGRVVWLVRSVDSGTVETSFERCLPDLD